MNVEVGLPYGKSSVPLNVPSNASVIQPQFVTGLEDERAEFLRAARNPIGAAPLKDLISANDKVAIVTADHTRALPSDRLLRWLFEELDHVPAEHVTIILGTGTHRPNSPKELEEMLGAEIANSYRVVNHDALDPETLADAGRTPCGRAVRYNKEYVQADKRIVMGFIEPHFMAGFSGGFKGVFPGIADIDSILHYHRASVIGDPRSTWGRLDDNPTQDQIRAMGALLPIDFLINVTLNRNHEITGCYFGEAGAAHRRGCEAAGRAAMVRCERRYPIVVTSNSGYPLDQNLYQTVKGMSAAAQIVEEGGLILAVARCNDGFPAHGNFAQFISEGLSPQALLQKICAPGFHRQDQWQAQLLALIQLKARVAIYSELPADAVCKANMEPVQDLDKFIKNEIEILGDRGVLAVLPEGPMTIPYVE